MLFYNNIRFTPFSEVGVKTLDICYQSSMSWVLSDNSIHERHSYTLNFPLTAIINIHRCIYVIYKKYKHKLLHGNQDIQVEYLRILEWLGKVQTRTNARYPNLQVNVHIEGNNIILYTEKYYPCCLSGHLIRLGEFKCSKLSLQLKNTTLLMQIQHVAKPFAS